MLNLSCSISSSFASKSLCTICLSCSAAISKRSLALKNNLKDDERTVSFFLDVYWETARIPPPHPRKFYFAEGGREDPIKNYKPRLSDIFFSRHNSLHTSRFSDLFRLKFSSSIPPSNCFPPKVRAQRPAWSFLHPQISPPQIFPLISRIIEREQISPGIL